MKPNNESNLIVRIIELIITITLVFLTWNTMDVYDKDFSNVQIAIIFLLAILATFIARDFYISAKIARRSMEQQQIIYYDTRLRIHNQLFFETYAPRWFDSGISMSLFYIKVDQFSSVCQQYGPLEGENYIMQVVDCLKKSFRPTDELVKMAEDEFILIFFHCPLQVAESKLASACSKLASTATSYNKSFRYGGIFVAEGQTPDVDEIIKDSRKKMLQNNKA
ncbi:MAG: diguanylate cyclase [Lachnospiraceae bacterium]|nr:diguanylate cyclase [Lachnospiraceae bacterium]